MRAGLGCQTKEHPWDGCGQIWGPRNLQTFHAGAFPDIDTFLSGRPIGELLGSCYGCRNMLYFVFLPIPTAEVVLLPIFLKENNSHPGTGRGSKSSLISAGNQAKQKRCPNVLCEVCQQSSNITGLLLGAPLLNLDLPHHLACPPLALYSGIPFLK